MHQFHSLGQDQSTVVQQAEMIVDNCSLSLWLVLLECCVSGSCYFFFWQWQSLKDEEMKGTSPPPHTMDYSFTLSRSVFILSPEKVCLRFSNWQGLSSFQHPDKACHLYLHLCWLIDHLSSFCMTQGWLTALKTCSYIKKFKKIIQTYCLSSEAMLLQMECRCLSIEKLSA